MKTTAIKAAEAAPTSREARKFDAVARKLWSMRDDHEGIIALLDSDAARHGRGIFTGLRESDLDAVIVTAAEMEKCSSVQEFVARIKKNASSNIASAASSLSPLQEKFREFFGALMDKWDVDSPADLSDEQKAEFFTEVGRLWSKGKGPTSKAKKELDLSASSWAEKETARVLSSLERGDVVKIGSSFWAVFKKNDSITAFAYKWPSKKKKIYRICLEEDEATLGDKVVVFEAGGSGQRISPDVAKGALKPSSVQRGGANLDARLVSASSSQFYKVTEPATIKIRVGAPKPTNEYFGAGRVMRKRLRSIDIGLGCEIHVLPGGRFLTTPQFTRPFEIATHDDFGAKLDLPSGIEPLKPTEARKIRYTELAG